MSEPYVTLDGSLIRELVRPEREGSRGLSLAEATLAPGSRTHRHWHAVSEEIYYVLAGEGVIEIGARVVPVGRGAAVLIPAGVEHCAQNQGDTPFVILCACSPPYQHEDTTLTEPLPA